MTSILNYRKWSDIKTTIWRRMIAIHCKSRLYIGQLDFETCWKNIVSLETYYTIIIMDRVSTFFMIPKLITYHKVAFYLESIGTPDTKHITNLKLQTYTHIGGTPVDIQTRWRARSPRIIQTIAPTKLPTELQRNETLHPHLAA